MLHIKYQGSRPYGFRREDFFFTFSLYKPITGKFDSAPWRPCFLTDQIYFNNLGRGSPKDHLCQIIFKSAQ